MADEERHDPRTGEIIETRAADGTQRYPSVVTLTDLILMLRDGRFNQEVADDIAEFSEKLETIGCELERKVKGQITLKIDVERDHDGVYFLTPQLTTKTPTVKHGRTIAWVTADNRLTPNKPHQGNLFGTIRDVSADRTVRTV